MALAPACGVSHGHQPRHFRSTRDGFAPAGRASLGRHAGVAGLGALLMGTRFTRSKRTSKCVFALDTCWPETGAPGRLLHGYGPVGLQRLQLSEDLQSFLLEDLSCEEDLPHLHSLGLESHVDHPNLPKHLYLEGYFHTLPTDAAVISANPRSGLEMRKPPASRRLRGFAEALRRCNRRTLQSLSRACPEGSRLRGALQDGRAFGDLALQIHWGDAVGPEDVQWHVDAPNSALHMAVSLHGQRTLQMKLRDPFALETHVVSERQEPRDVYIGNPAAFEHGLQYAAATWDRVRKHAVVVWAGSLALH